MFILIKIPDQLAAEEKALKGHEKMRTKVLTFQPDWDKFARLEHEEIPKIQSALEEIQLKEQQLQSEVESQISVVRSTEKLEVSYQSTFFLTLPQKQIGLMIDPAKDIMKAYQEITGLSARVAEAEVQRSLS